MESATFREILRPAMSEENLKQVERMVEAFKAGDAAAASEPLHPEIVWDVTRSPFDDLRGTYHGLDGVVDFWRSWFSAWESFDLSETELIDAGDHVIQWIARQTMRGRHSGIELDTPPFAFVFTFRDDQIVRMTAYWDRAEALAAVGLSQ